jgi:hypothetical protein
MRCTHKIFCNNKLCIQIMHKKYLLNEEKRKNPRRGPPTWDRVAPRSKPTTTVDGSVIPQVFPTFNSFDTT